MRGRRAIGLGLLLFTFAHASCGTEPTQLGVGTFEWTVTPDALTIQRGAAGSFAIRLNSKVNINANVQLGFSGNIPPNSTPTLNPASLGSTGRDATLRFQTTSDTLEGAYTIEIVATEVGAGTTSLSRRVDVVSGTGPDFTLEVNPLTITLTDRSPGPTITYYVRPRNGFQGTVAISIEGASAPGGAPLLVHGPSLPQLVFTGSGGQGGTFVPQVAERPTLPPSVTLTVRAVSGGIVHTMPLTVNIRLPAAARQALSQFLVLARH